MSDEGSGISDIGSRIWKIAVDGWRRGRMIPEWVTGWVSEWATGWGSRAQREGDQTERDLSFSVSVGVSVSARVGAVESAM
jgi:hypothetical protein